MMGSPTARAISDGPSMPASGNSASASKEVTGMGMVSNTHHVTIHMVIPKVRAESVCVILSCRLINAADIPITGPKSMVSLL